MINKLYLLTIFMVVAFAEKSQSQINEQLKTDLDLSQTKMFNCFSDGDASTFSQITGNDYLTINADGAYLNKTEAVNLIPKFKGSTYKIIEKQSRFYDNVAITTGRVKFYFKSILAADVYFTQTWILKENKWIFIGWQGTMTGQPKNYPIYLTLISILILLAIVSFIRKKIKRKNK